MKPSQVFFFSLLVLLLSLLSSHVCSWRPIKGFKEAKLEKVKCKQPGSGENGNNGVGRDNDDNYGGNGGNVTPPGKGSDQSVGNGIRKGDKCGVCEGTEGGGKAMPPNGDSTGDGSSGSVGSKGSGEKGGGGKDGNIGGGSGGGAYDS
ncbi:hypothetical protein ACLOJK_007938 [Asimina triloba]